MPEHHRNQTTIHNPAYSEHYSHHHRTNQSPASLIQVRQPEKNRRSQHRDPSDCSQSRQHGHRKTPIKKLFAESCCHRKYQKRKQFYRGLWQDPLRDHLNSSSRARRQPTNVPQIKPVECRNRRSADNRTNCQPGPLTGRQPQFSSRVPVNPRPPGHHRHNQPLKRNGGGVKYDPFHRPDLRHCQQCLQASPPTPWKHHAKHEKDQPDIPSHPPIRTCSRSTRNPPCCLRTRECYEQTRASILIMPMHQEGIWRHK